MAGMMVALRWDGHRLSRQELLDRANAAVNKVGAAYDHVDHLAIQAMPVEEQQYVQLVVNTNASQEDCQRMSKMLKDEFTQEAVVEVVVKPNNITGANHGQVVTVGGEFGLCPRLPVVAQFRR